jgi:hypothetical protein
LIHDLIVRLVYLARTASTQWPQNLVASGGNDFARRKTPRILSLCYLNGDIGGNSSGKIGDGRKDSWTASSLDMPMMVVGEVASAGIQFFSKLGIPAHA